MIDIPDIDILLSDRKAFDAFVYIPVRDAIIELQKRWDDTSIVIPIDIPPILEKGFRAIHSVCLISPNYQVRRFITIADAIDLPPLIFEKLDDKFTSNNEWKHSLSKLKLLKGMNKNNEPVIEHLNILDMNKANGTPVSELKTYWGQNIVDFHHQFFLRSFPHLNEDSLFDGSSWFKRNGGGPKEYYSSLLHIMVKHGILFENFMLDKKELSFTKEIFLPAFIEVYRKTGLKPLIVALEPTDIEGDRFWVSYPPSEHDYILEKVNGVVS